MVRRENSQLQQLSHHGRARAHTQFGKDTPQVRTHGPGADVEDIRDHFVWVPLGYQSHDLLFARAELNSAAPEPSHAYQKIAGAIHFGINQYFFSATSRGFDRSPSVAYDFNQSRQSANDFFDTAIGSFCGWFDGDQGWASAHTDPQCRTGAIINQQSRRNLRRHCSLLG